jgi:hypothetical protein
LLIASLRADRADETRSYGTAPSRITALKSVMSCQAMLP